MTVIHIDVAEETRGDTIRAMKSLKTLDCVKGHRLVVGGPSINTPPERTKGFEVVLLSLHENMTSYEEYRDSNEHQTNYFILSLFLPDSITRTHIFPNTKDILRYDFEVPPEEEHMWSFNERESGSS
ncbi:uncharacterized protein N7500_006010 [Penicillium coprophilum]|uniref:uncharacterized protein n=1 Tax=Penicillium coprophilum TaxID=36646 RepID=UPI00239B6D73|nr:uncharacterized protein N7500_006010 [Penicillium coprophilum]KAJ5164180.1 hypothetical protein N7500_006010 [Penicillium coprophilum]